MTRIWDRCWPTLAALALLVATLWCVGWVFGIFR